MNFGEALIVLKTGGEVRRRGWNGKGMSLYLATPHLGPQPMQATIVIFTAQQTHAAWLPSQTDVLSDDWELV